MSRTVFDPDFVRPCSVSQVTQDVTPQEYKQGTDSWCAHWGSAGLPVPNATVVTLRSASDPAVVREQLSFCKPVFWPTDAVVQQRGYVWIVLGPRLRRPPPSSIPK